MTYQVDGPVSTQLPHRRLDAVLRLAIQIANEIIPFDAHRVYISCPDRGHVWHFTKGFFSAIEVRPHLERSRFFYEHLQHPELTSKQLEEHERYILLQRLQLPEGDDGYISLSRPVVHGGWALSHPPSTTARFSNIEAYHLSMLAQLIIYALSSDDGYALLSLLHLQFLDGRMLVQDGAFDYIVSEYLDKALYVLHTEPWDSTRGNGHSIYASYKHVNDNGTALGITACRANSRDNLWTVERRRTRYDLPEEGSDADSFAGRAFHTRQAVWTDAYGQRVAPQYRLFEDVTCHISAPVVAGSGSPTGVLSIETSQPHAYSDPHAAAIALLAAHAYWPLTRAWNRERISRKAELFADNLLDIRNETDEWKLLEAFGVRLKQLGYGRGLFAKVVHRDRMIVGRHAWGANMDKVRDVTRRHFGRDSGDCQLIAVETREPVIIADPQTDPRAAADSRACGDLKPFAIYPITDNHGDVLWTIHLERSDVSRHNAVDKELIALLGMRVMKAWEEERRTQFERDWTTRMLHMSYFTLLDLLTDFSQFIVHERIARRCKVFAVSADRDAQQLATWAGEPPPRNPAFVLVEPMHRICQAMTPLLCTTRDKSTLATCSHFSVETDCVDRYEAELGNNGRFEWVEVPVRFAGVVVAKLVLDHVGAPDPEFTLGEMRLLWRLNSLLNAASDVIEKQRVITCLSAEGLHLNLLLHYCVNNLTSVQAQCAPHVEKRIMSAIESLRAKSTFVGGCEAARVKDVFVELGQATHYLKDDGRIPNGDIIFVPPASDHKVGKAALSLYLIVLTLVDNAWKHCRQASQPRVDISTRVDSGRLVVMVSDNGSGIHGETVEVVNKRLTRPMDFVVSSTIQGGKSIGLVLASLLAKQEHWELSLESHSTPTRFALRIPLRMGELGYD